MVTDERTGSGTVTGRIAGLDVARGLAVLGMFAAHLRIGGDLRLDPSTWGTLVNGRSSILFAVLAGVSVALLTGRSMPPTGLDLARARLRIFIRALWVFAIGAFLEALDTFVAIILGVYAVLFLLVLPFLRWPVRRLLGLAALVAVAGPPLLVVLGQVVTSAGAADDPVVFLTVTGYYPAVLWIAFVLVGLAIGRLDLGAAPVRRRLAAAGATAVVVGYSGGWLTTELLAGGRVSPGPEAGFDSAPGQWAVSWLTGAAPHSGTTFELVGSTGFAVLVLLACLVIAERLPALTAPLAAAGALALTVYAGQVVALRVLMEISPESTQGVGTWMWFASTALAGTYLWRRAVGRGPLEWLLTWTSSRAAGRATSAPAV